MTSPQILGPLSSIHQMLLQLVESLPEADAGRQFHPELGSPNWYLGRSVYQELFWLRETIGGDSDLSSRVKHLFTPGFMPLAEQCAQLPPADHMLNWAHEALEQNLTLLANPGQLPAHPLLENDRLAWFLLQEHGRNYEAMLAALVQRSLQGQAFGYQVREPLAPCQPDGQAKEIPQGHYRIGARDLPAAYDNELPPQAVELSSFRIGVQPVSNGEFLAFLQAGGYQEPGLWSEAGWAWRQARNATQPDHWCQDEQGRWYGVGINGPGDLPPNEPVLGLSQHEAQAFANWAAALGGATAGAVLPHEYQWELAARTGLLQGFGRAWEWCANPFHAYDGFEAFPSPDVSERGFERDEYTLKGGSLHTQPSLRRPSFRNHAPPEHRHLFAGTRLVFPPN